MTTSKTKRTVSLRMTVSQRDKLSRLGGAEWVRRKIDRATVKDSLTDGD